VSAPSPTPGFARTGHPVRDRLLAKAAEAQAEANAVSSSNDAFAGFGSLDELGTELDEIGISKAPSRPNPVKIAGTALSSTSLMLLGTLIGLGCIACLFALLIQFAPKDHSAGPQEPLERAVPATTVTPALALAPTETEAPSQRKKLEGPWRIGAAGSGERLIRGTVGKEPFLTALQNAGLEKSQAYRAYTALKEEKNLDRCRPSDEFVALLDSSGSLQAFEYIAGKEEIFQARTGKDGLLKGKQLDLKVKTERVQGALVMTSSSFADALKRAGLEAGLGVFVNKALDGHASVEQFEIGDRLRLVAQEVTVLGEFSRYAGIEALEYVPRDGGAIRIYYFPQRKKYFDEKGRAPGEGGWARPIKGAPITSKFNPNRLHPILKKRMPHNGTDFGAPTGTPLYASSFGTITKLGAYGANGNFIEIEHANGYETGYSHLSRFEAGLKVGDKVKREQVVGYVGTTGRSTGPHLHFSAKKNGVFIDAETLGFDALLVLPQSERQEFAAVKDHYAKLLDAVQLPPPVAVMPEASPTPSATTEGDMGDAAELELEAELSETPTTIPVAAPLPEPVSATIPAQLPVAPVTPPAAGARIPQGPLRSIYLSDKELLESQSASEDGEVDE
jgi:murein DD-endopeptidase MepM/ murein hydrolase activator NlpD